MNLSGWHALDLFFLILGCYFVIRGCFRGFVAEILTLAGFICSMYFSFKFSSAVGAVFVSFLGVSPYASKVLAVIVVWLAITLLTAMIRCALKGVISAVHLGFVDKLLGIFSGLLKTVILVYVVLVGGILLAPVVNPTWMTDSDALRYAGRNWPAARQILIDFDILPDATEFPSGTLEQILRPYRRGDSGPKSL